MYQSKWDSLVVSSSEEDSGVDQNQLTELMQQAKAGIKPNRSFQQKEKPHSVNKPSRKITNDVFNKTTIYSSSNPVEALLGRRFSENEESISDFLQKTLKQATIKFEEALRKKKSENAAFEMENKFEALRPSAASKERSLKFGRTIDYASLGISFELCREEKITAVFLYNFGNAGFGQYPGKLPFGISFEDLNPMVVAKLGEPGRKGKTFNIWIEYPSKGLVIDFFSTSWEDLRSRIKFVTIVQRLCG